MPGDKLKEGFYLTLALCPWFAGYFKQTRSGGLEVIVDKDKLNMPEYYESQSSVHFSKIQSSGFNCATWPDDLVPVGPFPCADKATGVMKLLHIHVMRLKDNSGVAISVNFNHGVADVTTIMIFLNCWADETRALVTGVPVVEATLCFGADVIKQYLPSERAPLNETTSKVLSAKSRVADFIIWLLPSMRGRLMNYLISPASLHGHLFRISRTKIDDIRNQVLEQLPYGTCLSTNDIVSAVAHRVHEQAVLGKSRGWFAKLVDRKSGISNEHCTFLAINYRHFLGMAELGYMGNPVIGEFVLTPMDQAHRPNTVKSISVIASQIRSQIAVLTPARIGQTAKTLDSDMEYATAMFAFAMKYKVVTMTTNVTTINMYGADFGHGVQAFSTIHPKFGKGVFMILPSPPSTNDILVDFCDLSTVMDSFMKNEFWSNFARLVY